MLFCLAYKTNLGIDFDKYIHCFKLHIVYGALAAPSEKAYNTVNDSPEAITFSWEISTTPVEVDGFKPTATVIIDSTKVDAQKLKKLEDILFGAEAGDGPSLPLPDEIVTLMKAAE